MNINLMISASSNFKGDDKSEQDFKITTFMEKEMLFDGFNQNIIIMFS